MSDWKVTGVRFDAQSRWCFTVTKGSKRVGLEEQDELEALLAPWPSIDSAPRDGTSIILRNGDQVTTGAWIRSSPTRPHYEQDTGVYLGEVDQKDCSCWAGPGLCFEPTSWMPL